MAETLRGDPGSYGVISGVGMHMQKHAYGVWSTEPGAGVWATRRRTRPPAAPLAIVGSPAGGPPWPRTRCCTAATAGPSGRCWSATSRRAGAATRCSTAAPPALAAAEDDELIGRHRDAGPAEGQQGELGGAGRSTARVCRGRTHGSSGASTAAGAAGSWPRSRRRQHGRRSRSASFPSLDVVGGLDAGGSSAVAIDIPIGLSRRGPRSCDTEAAPRSGPAAARSSPPRCVPCSGLPPTRRPVRCPVAPAGRRCRSSSTTSWPRSRGRCSAVARAAASDCSRSRPELSFAELAGAPMQHSKRTAEGRADRRPCLRDPPSGKRCRHCSTGHHPRERSGTTSLDALVGAGRLAATSPAATCGSAVRWTGGACAWKSSPDDPGPQPTCCASGPTSLRAVGAAPVSAVAAVCPRTARCCRQSARHVTPAREAHPVRGARQQE